MDDHQLLEAAAKAAGKDLSEYQWEQDDECGYFFCYAGDATHSWNPLLDDGDALRLAVKLRMDVQFFPARVRAWSGAAEVREEYGDDPYAATRRAIVRAAAAIGSQQ